MIYIYIVYICIYRYRCGHDPVRQKNPFWQEGVSKRDHRVCLCTLFFRGHINYPAIPIETIFLAPASNFRLSSLDMDAKKLMPIHLLQHLEALGRIAGSAEVEDQVWTLGIVIRFSCRDVAEHAPPKNRDNSKLVDPIFFVISILWSPIGWGADF